MEGCIFKWKRDVLRQNFASGTYLSHIGGMRLLGDQNNAA